MNINEAVEKWEKQGRTPEQIYGAKNFITSGPFLEWLEVVELLVK